MNPFGQELRKILTQCKTSGVVSYAGRSAYIQLDPDLRARLEFVSLNIAGQYNALKLTILNRTEGAVDVNKVLDSGSKAALKGVRHFSPPAFLWESRGNAHCFSPCSSIDRYQRMRPLSFSSGTRFFTRADRICPS